MARLFITPREIDYISDLTKEITKDVIGQVIYFYKTRVDLSEVHDVYEEIKDKVFDKPVPIDCRIQWMQDEIKTDRFGHENTMKSEIYIHYRDMLDRNITIQEGDFFSFGENFYEISSVKQDKIIFGQVEHITGFIIQGALARKGLIDQPAHGPTKEHYTDDGSIQENFVQQRGNDEMDDKRQLVSDGILDAPISNPRKIQKSDSSKKSSFYGDES